VRALLEQFGFHGDAQKQAMARLMNECGVETGHYRRPGSRMPAGGLRVGALPAAKWIEEDGDAVA
jgi:hypothetical protein